MEHPNSIRELFEQLANNQILLPDFQREYVWNLEKQKSLLASLLVNLSIGSLLMINGKSNDFLSKEIGFTVHNKNENSNPSDCKFLLDGQQRLTSIWSFFSDVFINNKKQPKEYKYDGWKEVWDKIYDGLKYRWFVKIKPDGESDFFGYNNLKFSIGDLQKKEPADILPHIFFKEINKTVGYDNWYHPEFYHKIKKQLDKHKVDSNDEYFEDSDESAEEQIEGKCKDKFIQKAAEEGLVPLYTLSNEESEDSAFHIDIINKIANIKLAEIQSKFENLERLNDLDGIIKEIKFLFENKKTETNIVKESGKWRSVENFKNFDYIPELYSLVANWKTEVKNYFNNVILSTELNQIILEKNQIQRAIAIFTAINEGGQKLSTFDLVVAKAAKVYKENSLLQEIKTKIDAKVEIPDSLSKDLDKTDWSLANMGCFGNDHIEINFQNSFLNVLSALVHTDFNTSGEVFSDNLSLDYFKTAKQLEMTPDQIANNFEKAMLGLQRAHAFLQFRCGLVSGTDLQYRLMLLPIVFCLLNDNCWNNASVINQLECWYWSSIFSGVYRDNQNDKACKDTKYLYDLIVLKKNINNYDIIPIEKRMENIFTEKDYTDEQTLCLETDYAKVPKSIHFSLLQYILSKEPTDFIPKRLNESGYKLKAWELSKAKYKEKKLTISINKGDNETEKKDIKNLNFCIWILAPNADNNAV